MFLNHLHKVWKHVQVKVVVSIYFTKTWKIFSETRWGHAQCKSFKPVAHKTFNSLVKQKHRSHLEIAIFLFRYSRKKKTCHRCWTCPHVCAEYMVRVVSLGCGPLLVYIITNKPINADWESYETRGDWTEPLASVIHSECYVDLQGSTYIFRRLTGSRAVLVCLLSRCKELQR